MAQLGHSASFDLADAFASQTEMFAYLFERARFATVKAETKLENFAFALVEWAEQPIDFVRQQRSGRNLER